MRIGCFAFALALVASALTAEAWSPPFQTQRLYYTYGDGLLSTSNTMSLDGKGAFTIRFTGLKFDWNFRDYGQLFRMKATDRAQDIVISFTGAAYSTNANKLVARLEDNKDVYTDVLPDWGGANNWMLPDTKGLDVVLAFNGTSGKLTFYIDGSVDATSQPQGSVPYVLPTYTDFFSGNGAGENAYYEVNGYQEALTVWAGVALDADTVREAHEGFYANVPTPNHHYSFCEGGVYTTELDVLSGRKTSVTIKDHITGLPAYDLTWTGQFEQFREAPAEGEAVVGAASECCEAKSREFGFSTRAPGGTFRTTVDSLSPDSVDEGRRCHAAP